MPREAAERLVTRLWARKQIEAEQEGFDLDGLLSEVSGVSANEEALDDYSVEHGKSSSSLWHLPDEFVDSLLEQNERRIFWHRVAQITWTDPRVQEMLKKTKYYELHPNKIDSMIRLFTGERSRSLAHPKFYVYTIDKFSKKVRHILSQAAIISINLAFKEQRKTVLTRLNDLCKEIAEQRRKNNSKVRYVIKASHGTLSFEKFPQLVRSGSEIGNSTVTVVFRKNQ